MLWDDDYRKKIGTSLALVVADALSRNQLTVAGYKSIGRIIVDTLRTIQTHDELIAFLKHLSEQYSFIAPIANQEETKKEAEKEAIESQELVSQITNDLKSNQT